MHVSEGIEHPLRLAVLEFVQRVLEPLLKEERSFTQDGLPRLRHIPGGMGEIQDANGILTMQVNEPLFPLGPIRDGTHLAGRFCAPPMDFHQSQVPKFLRLR